MNQFLRNYKFLKIDILLVLKQILKLNYIYQNNHKLNDQKQYFDINYYYC